MVSTFRFDEVTHRYFFNDKPVPSVTTVLNEWVSIKVGDLSYKVNTHSGLVIGAEVMDNAADRGEAIHAACEIILKGGDLDTHQLPDEIADKIEAFWRWMKLMQPKCLRIEEPLLSKRYVYAGRPDLVAEIYGNQYIIDIKTGMVAETVGAQLAGYEQLHVENGGNRKKMKRAVLTPPVTKGGEWKLKEVGGRYDWRYFLAKLEAYKLRQQL